VARPREFDENDVLEKALHVFWVRGYEGASMAELLAAMGITNSSLYKAFGSKEDLFRRITERYRDDYLGFRQVALAEPTPRRIVERLLLGTVDLLTGEATPPGCLEVNGALAGSSGSDTVRAGLVRNRRLLRTSLRERLPATLEAGSLPAGLDVEQVAMLVATLAHGLAVQAKDGASREELRAIVRAFLCSWPEV
jgi:AcrR family transcriptional regulator